METTDVYAFGAGASAALKVPLTKDFLLAGFHTFCLSPLNYFNNFPKGSFYEVARFIDTLYGSDIEKEISGAATGNEVRIVSPRLPAGITIEHLLTFVDLAIANGDSWMDFGAVKHALHDFIFETLDYATKSKYGGSWHGQIKDNPNIYDRFVRDRVDLNARNFFITFNYELLLDYALWEIHPRMCADYSLDFVHVNLWPQYDEMRQRGRSASDADLLKLHGSLNWARCEQCGFYLFSFQTYNGLRSEVCQKCGATLSPVLVPPTLRKNIAAYGIGQLWLRAEEALSAADRITIIGYSFPDADVEAQWLFKRAVAKGGKKPKLTIVEPCLAVRKKIVELFGKTVADPVYVQDFESYVGESSTS